MIYSYEKEFFNVVSFSLCGVVREADQGES